MLCVPEVEWENPFFWVHVILFVDDVHFFVIFSTSSKANYELLLEYCNLFNYKSISKGYAELKQPN